MRQPVTDANIAHHNAVIAARLASGDLSLDAVVAAPARIRLRNVFEEMVQYFLENPGCTRDDLEAAGFDDRQIGEHHLTAAREANRRWHRRNV